MGPGNVKVRLGSALSSARRRSATQGKAMPPPEGLPVEKPLVEHLGQVVDVDKRLAVGVVDEVQQPLGARVAVLVHLPRMMPGPRRPRNGRPRNGQRVGRGAEKGCGNQRRRGSRRQARRRRHRGPPVGPAACGNQATRQPRSHTMLRRPAALGTGPLPGPRAPSPRPRPAGARGPRFRIPDRGRPGHQEGGPRSLPPGPELHDARRGTLCVEREELRDFAAVGGWRRAWGKNARKLLLRCAGCALR